MDYPAAPALDLVEHLHGHRVADPYRWLEDAASPRTLAWSAAQDRLARGYLDRLPGRAHLGRRLRARLEAGYVEPPTWRAGRGFFTRRSPGQQHGVLCWRDGEAVVRRLVDPGELDPAGLTTLDGWSPSRDGRLLAYQLSSGGDEESLLRVVDVVTGELLDGPVARTRYSPVAWLPPDDPAGPAFYYVRRLSPEQVPAGEEQLHRRVYLHRVGTPTAEDVLVFGAGLDKTHYYGVSVSRDGRWLVVSASPGTAPRDDVWVADLADTGPAAPDLRAVQVGVDAQTWLHVDCTPGDGRLYALTDRQAPRRRLCVTTPADASYQTWTDLVEEDDEAVLESFALAEDALVVLRSRWGVSELSVHDRVTGQHRYDVVLPGVGEVSALSAQPEGGGDVWLGWTDHTTAPRVHRLDTAAGTLRLWADAPGAMVTAGVQVDRVLVSSPDGTAVPLTLVHRSDVTPDGARPTVLYGYGGFNISLTPSYSPTLLAWVEAGGVWAVANLRGGSEGGEEWHRAGMRQHKQNVLDDLHACAGWLQTGWTDAEHLGISGGSNGGLLVGAALTQRPELYRAVVCSTPLLDMARYELFGLGQTWNDEYGRADDPVELGWLLGYSPYHRVVDGTGYPAVLFTVFDSDTRVDPLHARKMAAALQQATSAPPDARPVLLRREPDVGHGARSVDRTVGLGVDTLAFLAAQLGLDLAAADGAERAQ